METEISNIIAISEATPGPLGVNMATYTGFLTSGVIGGIIATLGLITPSITIIIIISKYLIKFDENKITKKIFYGLRAGVIALILVTGINMLKETLFTPAMSIKYVETILFIVFLIIFQKTKLHPIWLILLSGIIGGVLSL